MEQPLVSIVVITYNSAKTVIETLDSARNQTYQNIELIISDDCSTDDTVEICRNWIDENKDRFVRTELITVEKNTGTSLTFNRGLFACSGEWVKCLAGDDIFISTCIEKNINYAMSNPNITMIFSRPIKFVDDLKLKKFKPVDSEMISAWEDFGKMTSEEQFRYFHSNSYHISTPTIFFKRIIYINVGGCDDYGVLEDLPLTMKLLKLGYKYTYMDDDTIYYRISSSSICNHPGSLFNMRFEKAKIRYYKDNYKFFSKKILFRQFMIYPLQCLYHKFNINNTKNRFWRYIYICYAKIIGF